MDNKPKIGTIAIHSGEGPYDHALPTSAAVDPIHMSNMFKYDSVEDYMECIKQGLNYPMYTRAFSGNPTLRILKSRLAAIYGAESAMVTSSGMSAISNSFIQLLNPGDHVVLGLVFRMTSNLLAQIFEPKMNVNWDLVVGCEVSDFEAAITDKTRVIFLEVPTNPTLDVIDLEGICKMAHERGIMVWVDDTLASPVNLKPFELGADLVLASLTKYMNGHGNAIGGAIIGSKELVGQVEGGCYGKMGAAISPFNAWLMLQGLKTLHLRMAQHNKTAQKIAEFLEAHPKIESVYYPGLPSHPQHELAKKMMSGFGGIVSFIVKGDDDSATTMVNNMKFLCIGTSFGQAETLIETGLMVYYGMSMKERGLFGVSEGFIRMAIGLEDSEDLIRDLDQALAEVKVVKETGVKEIVPRFRGIYRPSEVENE